jgi:pyruvate,water dikinase
LQSRPITTLEEAEAYEELLKDTRAELRELIGKARGPWVVHNISETLPHPTPLTWSVIKRFMSGGGGFGAMYRQAGFEPSAAVTRDGFLTLVAGKIYMDASMTPEMFFEGFPFKYDIEALRKNPDAAQNPPTIPSGSVGARVKMARKAGAASAVVHTLAADYDKQLTEKLIPDLLAYVREEKRRDLKALSNDELIELWHTREKRVMDEFAPQSLLPSLISGAALAELKSFLEENFWDEDPDQLATLLSSGHEADKTVGANTQLYEVARDEKMAVEWLVEYGHRAPEEFDLSTPRWRERPDELLAMARRLKDGKNPADLHHTHLSKCNDKLEAIKAQLGSDDRAELDEKVALARRYMPFREDGKFYLMMGYDLLRDLALEIGRRLEIDSDVFLLTMEEMFDALNIGFAPTHLLAQRKIQRRAEKRIPLPYVIDQSNIEEIGSPPKIDREGAMQAFAISPGGASGPARIVKSPSEAGDLGERYILVCPSTDPSWTPLFTNAAGLILECGGTLSHGAVVAREMSIPAVVLRDACTLLRDGDVITVDGRNGIVSRAVSTEEPAAKASDSPSVLEYKSPETPVKEKELRADLNDTRIDRSLVPPPTGKRERQSAKIRNIFLLIWGVYLAATFLLPENILYQPSLSFLDIFLWPLVRAFGRPWAVAIISGALGALTMIGQKFLTDNDRLLVAKRRAAALRDEAFKLPKDCPRDKALLALAAPVQMRIFMASLVPMAVMLGPLIMIFFWFPPRVDLAAWNLPPGSTVTVQALVKNESKPDKGATTPFRDPVTIQLPNDLGVGATTPKTQAPPPIRETLAAYRTKLAKASDLSAYPEEIREAVEGYREQRIADLDTFLSTEIPPHIFEWSVLTPNTAGRWPVTVSAGSERQTIDVVLGDAYPPAPAEISGDARSRIVSLKVVYPDRDNRQKFFTPIGHWDWGWLGVYLLAYLPAMFGMRAILKIA